MGPLLTGASSAWMPSAANAWWIRRIRPGVLVLRSKYTFPRLSPSSRPPSPRATASTSAGPGKEVNTMSLACANCRGVSAQVAGCQLPPDFVDHQLVSALEGVIGHVAPHDAQSDEPYLHCDLQRAVRLPGRPKPAPIIE